MKAVVTSKEEILRKSRELIRIGGWNSINIRSVARGCNVSVGSIYNYFESKSSLMLAVVESIWQEIFKRPDTGGVFSDAEGCIRWLFAQVENGAREYPGIVALHSDAFAGQEKESGKERMKAAWEHIKELLCAVIAMDENVKDDAFSDKFTLEEFSDILFSLVLSAVIRQQFNPEPAVELAKRILY